MAQKYPLAEYERIKNVGFKYALPDEVLKLIQSVAEQVGAPGYVKTPNFESRVSRNNNTTSRPRAAAAGHNNDDWDALRKFQATVLIKKTGIDTAIEQIRKHLNKITTKTYGTLKDEIIKEIEVILQLESADTPLALNKIGEALFSIASGNIFYAQMYATLYKELMEKYAFMQDIFETNFLAVHTLFHDFAYCDPNENYDQFCANNKTNERRRALSHFYVNLMAQGVIAVDRIAQIIATTQELLLTQINAKNSSSIADEITETLAIFVLGGAKQLKAHADWARIYQQIEQVSVMNRKDYLSLTNKAIFKHLDILDKLVKL